MSLRWTAPPPMRQYPVMSAAIAALAAFFGTTGADAAGVTGVRVDDARIAVSFDGDVASASTMVLTGPHRIAIDISGATRGEGGGSSTLVGSVRQAQFDPDTARIVLDLAQPALVQSGRFTPDGRTLELTLKPAASGEFAAAAASARKLYRPAEAHRSAPPRSRYSVTIPLAPPGRGVPRPKIYGPAGRPLVVIDAGHGGHDPGAISPHGGRHEKELTLAVARRMKDELLASGRVRVALTREDDRYLVLRERSAIARNIGADLFISVHADSAGSPATGATIYTLSEVASDREAAQLAARENKADIINGVNLSGENADIASILVDLAQRETMNASSGFADLLKREGSRHMPFRADYHRMAGFAVLKAPDTPAILLEIGYLTSESDVERLFSEQGQKNIATAVRKAVEIHFARRLAMR